MKNLDKIEAQQAVKDAWEFLLQKQKEADDAKRKWREKRDVLFCVLVAEHEFKIGDKVKKNSTNEVGIVGWFEWWMDDVVVPKLCKVKKDGTASQHGIYTSAHEKLTKI